MGQGDAVDVRVEDEYVPGVEEVRLEPAAAQPDLDTGPEDVRDTEADDDGLPEDGNKSATQ
jgi:hypothetical protein